MRNMTSMSSSTSWSELEVTQDGFSVTPPAEEECGGLGGVIGMLLGGPVNSYTLGFEVGTV